MTTTNLSFAQQVKELQEQWDTDPRWKGVERPYSAEDVVRLRGTVQPEHTYAKNGANKLWQLIHGKAQEKCHSREHEPDDQALEMVRRHNSNCCNSNRSW